MDKKLVNMKCQPCSGKTQKLDTNEISSNLIKINNWNTNNEKEMIFKKFEFKDFKKALDFTNQIGSIAEIEGHHPDISIGYGYCLVMIHTHAIKGLSINDFILASKIDLIKQ
ncbi:MAG: putative pterin-4-alpha-carbinolamine dehydratase [Alphaproteobacteria bacterium MarineAlpha5_Bin8]|nr:MAG: putative pterin-4-alpha-carbinolamine dehydratase [Alphaproteobacteria bacterium MarineAlpha5_Bin7]PPR45813.1 MAG: putative pterin-4-alpha-carbinolamine dehydratase [Alphaproteobacteria bacterium MarineAlpha5_Bin8]PPR54497.1 MAG: putative pterin-4-alpha-carbinolamine dehydratase [Alphaproteobacteria bacterium MarineAlpha5_Bin6]|tara:strand:+ start:2318 stop:2653 length:336 start_codon:yes stop_codon:yes gene_type:complete